MENDYIAWQILKQLYNRITSPNGLYIKNSKQQVSYLKKL